MYTALYLPTSPDPDPSRSGFPTKEAAWDWIYTEQMCTECKNERKDALSEEFDFDDEEHSPPALKPPCALEWLVLKTTELDKCATMDEIMECAGWKTIWEAENPDL